MISSSKYKLYEDCELKPAGQIIGGAGELIIANFGSEGNLLQDGDGQVIPAHSVAAARFGRSSRATSSTLKSP